MTVNYGWDMSASEWIAFLALIASVVGGTAAFWFRHLANQRERELIDAREQIARVDTAAVAWGFRCIEAMSEAEALMRNPDENATGSHDAVVRVLATLSALVDQGRMFFPNVNRDLVGTDKAAAMRGYRPAILDALLIAYFELEFARRNPNVNDEQQQLRLKNVFNARRAFISELQEALDPLRDGMLAVSIQKRRTDAQIFEEADWEGVRPLVSSYEERAGKGSFWGDPPRTRIQIEADASRRR